MNASHEKLPTISSVEASWDTSSAARGTNAITTLHGLDYIAQLNRELIKEYMKGKIVLYQVVWFSSYCYILCICPLDLPYRKVFM